MKIKVGCDIVDLKKFDQTLRRGGTSFLKKIFTAHELGKFPPPQTLAGIFCAKEAAKKALNLKAGDWQGVEVLKDRSGRPTLNIHEMPSQVVSSDLSISHDGNYAMAVVVVLVDSP